MQTRFRRCQWLIVIVVHKASAKREGLRPGDVILVPPGVYHEVTGAVRLISMYAPAVHPMSTLHSRKRDET